MILFVEKFHHGIGGLQFRVHGYFCKVKSLVGEEFESLCRTIGDYVHRSCQGPGGNLFDAFSPRNETYRSVMKIAAQKNHTAKLLSPNETKKLGPFFWVTVPTITSPAIHHHRRSDKFEKRCR